MNTMDKTHDDIRFIRTTIYILFILLITSTPILFAGETDMRLGGHVEITTKSLPCGYKGDDYSTRVYITGGSGEYIFHPTSLPSGLSLNESGRLEGIITADISTHSFRVIVSDTLNEAKLYEKILKLTVFEKLVFRKEIIKPAVKGVDYKQKIKTTGGSGDFKFKATGLPKGLSIDGSGLITGVPEGLPGEYNIKLIVFDKAFKDKKIVKEELFTLYSPLGFITEALAVIKNHSQANILIKGDGGSGEYRFSSANLPAGLKLEKSGALSGVTTVPRGSYNITVIVIDPNTHVSTEKQFTLTVVDFFPDEYEALNDNDLKSENTMLPEDDDQNHSFNEPGDIDFIRLDLKTILPDDVIHIAVHKKTTSVKPVLTVYSSEKKTLKTIAIKDKGTVADFLYKCASPGLYYAGVTEASGETGEYRFSLSNKGPGTRFETQSLPTVLKKSKISLTLNAIDGSENYHFTAEGLPKGLSFSEKGIISGTVTVPSGEYSFKSTVSDTDWRSISETRTFTLQIVDFFPDKYEFSDDDDFETNNRLVPGNKSQHHTFNMKGDKDYIALDLTRITPGNIIDIHATRLTAATKPVVTLYRSNKSKILSSLPTEKVPRLLFECKTPGTYYLLAEEASRNTGEYNLSVVDTGPKVKFKTKIIPDILKKGKNSFQLKAMHGSKRYHFSSHNLPGKLIITKDGLLAIKDDTGLKKGEYLFSVKVKDLDYPGIFDEKFFTLNVVDFYPDQYETKDDNSFETSNIIQPDNTFQYHTFNYDGDVDYINLDLSKTPKDNVICISTSVNSASAKTSIDLFGNQKKLLKPDNNNGGNTSSTRYFKCTDPGFYYLKISEPDNKTGDYGLSIKDLGPATSVSTETLPDVLTNHQYSHKISVKDGSGHYRFKINGLPKNFKINSSGLIKGKLPAISGTLPFTVIIEDIKYPGTATSKKIILKVVEFFPDEYEKAGDNNYFTTNYLTPGKKEQKHTFNFKGDVDYTRIDLSGCRSGDLIKIIANRLSKKTGARLTLFNSEFKKIMTGSSSKNKNYSQIIFLCKSPGLYYLKTTEQKNDVGDYSLKLINTGQQLQITATSIPDILWGQTYNSQLLIVGGSGKFRVKTDNIPANLAINNMGAVTGTTKIKSNKAHTFDVLVHDASHPENAVRKTISFNVVDYYPDSYEKNNDNDFSTTNTLISGSSQKHNFNFPGDEDFIRLDLSKATPEDVVIIESSRLGAQTDTHFILYDDLQNELVKDDNSGSSGYSKIVFNCQKPGVFFLKTASMKKSTGAYLIKMNNSGQPVAILTKYFPIAESPESYASTLKTSGGCGEYTFSIKKGNLPNGLKLNAKSGLITGKNKNWGAFKFTVTAKDKNFPDNQTEIGFLINTYVGRKLTGTENVNYPFYVGETLNAEGYYNTMTAVPGLIHGGVKRNLRYNIINHNIPYKRFNFNFNNKTAELTLKEPAIVACEQYKNLNIDVAIEVCDIINKNNKMKFHYQIPVKCLVY